MKKLRGYIFSRPFMEERVPQHVQNIILRNYCEKNNYAFLLSSVEYKMNNSFKGGDKYFWSEDTVVDLGEATRDLSKDSKIRFVTKWIEDNCEIEEDLNYMVEDLVSKIPTN